MPALPLSSFLQSSAPLMFKKMGVFFFFYYFSFLCAVSVENILCRQDLNQEKGESVSMHTVASRVA